MRTPSPHWPNVCRRKSGSSRWILRGHGFSDKPPTGYSVEQHVEDLSELMTVLALHRPVVLGFSIGGAIAAFLAARSDCRGLILLEGVIGDRAFTENAAATGHQTDEHVARAASRRL